MTIKLKLNSDADQRGNALGWEKIEIIQKKIEDENKIKDGEDYFSWRLGWFKKAREKGGWDVPKWPEKFGGPGWSPQSS